MDKKTMTDKQAYAAMFHFLKENWKRNKSLELGGVLGFMSLLSDGSPADPAVVKDWKAAVEFALVGGKASSLELH